MTKGLCSRLDEVWGSRQLLNASVVTNATSPLSTSKGNCDDNGVVGWQHDRMELRNFTPDDWHWVQDWFQHELLDRELGPMNTTWLEAVLADRKGTQLVATIEIRPVALIGCVWATVEHPSHYTTDIAVAPDLRRQELASKALQIVMAWPADLPTAKWTAFVNPRNIMAQSLLRKNAWKDAGVSNGMIEFEKYRAS